MRLEVVLGPYSGQIRRTVAQEHAGQLLVAMEAHQAPVMNRRHRLRCSSYTHAAPLASRYYRRRSPHLEEAQHPSPVSSSVVHRHP